MSKKETLARQSIIIKALRKRPMTFAELSDRLDLESEIRGYNYRISKRTFNRDVEEIRDLYHLEIRYDYSKRAFIIIEDGDYPSSERLLDAFNTYHAIEIGEQLSQNFELEARRAAGMEHIFELMHLIRNKLCATIYYHKFLADAASEKNICPLALKEFKNRWYLVAVDKKDEQIKTYGLDRITEVVPGKRKFSPPENFNLEEMFHNCFGIITPNEDNPVKIVLSFDVQQGKYIESMPLHHSQQLLLSNEHEFRISLLMNLTFDFLMELHSYGSKLKVLEPKSLIKTIKKELQATLALYD